MAVPEGRGDGAVTVVVCDGHRCHALRDRTDAGAHSSLLEALRERVRRSRYAVLIRSGCLGVCARAPAVWLVRRPAPQIDSGPGELFGPVEDARHVRAVLEAVPVDHDDPR